MARLTVEIREARFPEEAEIARALLLEYGDSLAGALEAEAFGQELAGLPGDYAAPSGHFYLADGPDGPLGCVGLRRFGPGVAEMKRLYVRTEGRSQGIGRLLAQRVIEEAQHLGYRELRLDTLPTMEVAQSLYLSLGFREIPPYRYNPVPGTRYFALALDRGAATLL